MDYNANSGFGYDAGAYTLSVVYTATQQILGIIINKAESPFQEGFFR